MFTISQLIIFNCGYFTKETCAFLPQEVNMKEVNLEKFWFCYFYSCFHILISFLVFFFFLLVPVKYSVSPCSCFYILIFLILDFPYFSFLYSCFFILVSLILCSLFLFPYFCDPYSCFSYFRVPYFFFVILILVFLIFVFLILVFSFFFFLLSYPCSSFIFLFCLILDAQDH